MNRKQVFDLVADGKEITKANAYKFKHNKIVRGSFYDYSIEGQSITENQWEAIQDKFKLIKLKDKSTPSINVYKIFTL